MSARGKRDMILSRILLSSCAAAAMLAVAGTAAAATSGAATTDTTQASSDSTTLGTVIVTARRREENLQRVPATVTAVNSAELRKANIVTVSDLATVTPSLSIASYFNDLNDRFAVRGLSAGVETYFADAPCCGGVASAPFLDISNTQVLNGPQGTLFGRSSAAGAVLIYPNRPNLSEWGGSLDATVGTYSRTEFTGVVNVPLVSDHLGLRIAVNANHVDGYTSLFGLSEKLDGIDNQQFRVGLEFKSGSFDNYLVVNYLNVDEPGTALVFAAGNPNFALYNLSPAAGVATFTGVCTTAVGLGLASNVASYISQRTAAIDAIGTRMRAEIARVAPGGSALRSTYPSYDSQMLRSQLRHGSLVDVAQYDFGDVGPVKLNVKNIFSYDSYTSNASTTNDGLGGMGEQGAFANAFYSNFGANNEVGNTLTPKLGAPLLTYTEEFQVHGNLNDGLLLGTVGFFYQDQIAQTENGGTTNVYQLFSGVLNPNLGYNNAVGFVQNSPSTEWAWYTQFTLDLDKVGVHGLSLTGGYRDTWDDTSLTTLPAVINYPSGIYTPGSPASTTSTKSSGYNYTFSAAEQFNSDIMGYVTVSRAYVPGGVNALGQSAQTLPNFTPTYAPETVLEEEIGFKTEFSIAGMATRLNADYYHNDFSNIAETLTGLIGTTSVRYNENIAGATLQGVEVAGTFIPTHAWNIGFAYSYNDAKYTKWTGSDPFNIAQPGNPLCVPSSPAGLCYLDLTNNPFPLMPVHQGHVTVTYYLPVDQNLGDVSVSAIVYAQSRVYYEATAARDLQLFPGGLNGISQGGYATLNLRLDWDDIKRSGWNAGAFVTNATNAIYATGKVAQIQTLGFAAANYAPPAMFGLEVWKKFGP
jgi:iron complex outermembrane recepter protein